VVAVGAAVCRLPAWQVLIVLQTRLVVAVAGVDSYSVDLQTVRGTQEPPDSYLPAPHVEQTRSDVAVGATLCVSPDLHVDHLAQAAALSEELKAPLAQGAHLRSATADGATLTNAPAAHTLSDSHSRLVSAVGATFSYSVALHSTRAAQIRS
jgi:hypothetical protein